MAIQTCSWNVLTSISTRLVEVSDFAYYGGLGMAAGQKALRVF